MGTGESTERAGAAAMLRRLLGGASGTLWLVAAVAVGWLMWPSSLGGCTTLTIVSGQSMEPTYYTGDLVVSRCGPVEVDDVIVYNPPGVAGARVIHRIVDGDADEGWLVQGDNNDFLDPWRPTQEHILGSAVLHLPHVGKVASILLSPLTWISLLVVALAVVIWPGKEDEDSDEDPGGDAVAPPDTGPGGPERADGPTHDDRPGLFARLAGDQVPAGQAPDAARAPPVRGSTTGTTTSAPTS